MFNNLHLILPYSLKQTNKTKKPQTNGWSSFFGQLFFPFMHMFHKHNTQWSARFFFSVSELNDEGYTISKVPLQFFLSPEVIANSEVFAVTGDNKVLVYSVFGVSF